MKEKARLKRERWKGDREESGRENEGREGKVAQKQSTTKKIKKAELNYKAPANKREWNGANG